MTQMRNYIDISNGVLLEKADKFCYLEDTLMQTMSFSSNSKSEMCKKKFQEYLPILTGKGFSLKLKVKYIQVV